MKEPLRPSTLGDILDRTAYLYRTRFLVFFGIAVVPTAVILVFASGTFLLFAWSGAGKASDFATGIMALVLIIVGMFVVLPTFLVVSALASAAMNHAVARANLGESTSIRDAYKAVWWRGWNYIGLYILEGLIVWGAPSAVWFVLVFFSSIGAALAKTDPSGGALLGLFFVVSFVAMVAFVLYMLLRLSLSFPACVVEQIGAVAALKRSSTLTRGTRGRIFLLYLLGAVLGWMLTMVITVPVTILSALIPGASSPEHAQTIGMVLLFVVYGASFAIQSLTRPIYGIALVLFYYDQRIRLEGFDIEWMMLQAGLVPPSAAPATPPEAAPWLPPVTPRQQPAEAPDSSASADSPPGPTQETSGEAPQDSSQSKLSEHPLPVLPPAVSED
jgi:hypothetical protein